MDSLASLGSLFRFCDEASHQTIGDGGANPYLGEHIVSVFVDSLKIHDVQMIECCDERIDGEDDPQVALGVAFPLPAGIEVGQRAEQQH